MWKYSAPANHLISGLVVRYYSDQRPWFRSDAEIQTYCNQKPYSGCVSDVTQKNQMVRIFQTQMIDIDTVYITNPIEPTQIYKPIEFRTGSEQQGRLQSNDVWEVKLPKDWYAFQMEALTDPSTGAFYGLSLVAVNFWDPPKTLDEMRTKTKIFQIGQAWSYRWGPKQIEDPNNKFVYYYNVFPDVNLPSFQTNMIGWLVGFGGKVSTRDPANQYGQYMTFDLSQFTWADPPSWAVKINFQGDYNYQCCWGLDPTRCNSHLFPNHQMCFNATAEYCTKKPTDYMCKKRAAYYKTIGINIGEDFEVRRTGKKFENFDIRPQNSNIAVVFIFIVIVFLALIGINKYSELNKKPISINTININDSR